jgi:hypothetical protein
VPHKNPDDDQLARYLLGRLAPELRADIEARYLEDPAFLERLEQVESRLIEDYVEGDLEPGQRALFEREYLRNPERRRKVELAALLIRRFRRVPRFSVSQLAGYAVAAAVLLAMGLWSAYGPPRLPEPVVVRSTGMSRGGSSESQQRIKLPRRAPVLYLKAAAAGQIDRAALRTVEDETPVWAQKVVNSRSVDLMIESAILEDRDYILTLEGNGQTLASYSFRLQRE